MDTIRSHASDFVRVTSGSGSGLMMANRLQCAGHPLCIPSSASLAAAVGDAV